MVTVQNEGVILKNRLEKAGKKLKDVAAIMGIKRKKLKRELKKVQFSDKFRKNFEKREMVIFKEDFLDVAGEMVDSLVKNIIYLKASDRISAMLLCELASKINHTSYTAEALQLEKNIREEADSLSAEYLKKND